MLYFVLRGNKFSGMKFFLHILRELIFESNLLKMLTFMCLNPDQIGNSNNTNKCLSNVSGAVSWKALDMNPDLDQDVCRF